jgi:flagellar hook-length control protein FliK
MKPPFDNSVTIKLNPPGLGLMEIRVKMDKDKHLTTTINADNREVFKIINAHADKLKDYLVSQGFKVENVNIQNGLQEHGSFGQNAQNGFGNSQNQAQTNQRSQYYFSNNVRDDVKSETEQINRQISKNGLDITV